VSCHTLAFNRRTVAFSIVRDITGRKNAEAALCESEGKWRTLAESTPVAIMIYQGDHLVYMNPAGEWMSGYSADELYAMDYWNLMAPEFRQLVRERGRQRQDGERLPYSYDIRMIAKDGSSKWISVTGNQIQYSGRPAGLISAVDITERKKSEDLIALTSRKLALMNDMTHQDLQNKITGLRGYVELAREAKTEEERSAYSDKEERILADIHHMIKNCKDYQEMGVNQPRWIPVEESIRIAASIVSPGPGITVESHLAGLELYADPLIEKIFSHLIDNAVRHGKTTTHIRFLCEPTNEGVLVICEDDGAGIPETKKKNLFRRGTGTVMGFGLFFVRECLLINGMTIAEMNHPSTGARFGITVPNGMYRFGKPA
jgi:PAS domain S-box-containing protein